jgi:hypothetical protein
MSIHPTKQFRRSELLSTAQSFCSERGNRQAFCDRHWPFSSAQLTLILKMMAVGSSETLLSLRLYQTTQRYTAEDKKFEDNVTAYIGIDR